MSELISPLAGYSCGPVGFFDAEHLDLTHDVRGLLLAWELPRRDATYVLGADPTVGITGWTLSTATTDDRSTDNGAIEVVRVGRLTPQQVKGPDGKPETCYVRAPDIQVAEYAAPVDPITFAAVINAIGKLYRGDAEDDGCLVIHEAYPGPGLAVTPELISRYGYTNLFIPRYLNTTAQKRTIEWGWTTSHQSKQLLWMKTNRHMKLDGLRIQSPYLLEELVDDSSERFMGLRRQYNYVSGPRHDDRSMAMRLALWGAHEWTMDAEQAEDTRVAPINSTAPDPQRQLISAADAKTLESERWERLLDEAGGAGH